MDNSGGSGADGEQVEVKEENTDDGESGKAKFQVNMGLIPSAALNDETDALKGLGLDVFNQEDLEQGVLQQVDQAIAKEEEARKKAALKKELKQLNDSIRSLKHEMASIATQMAQLRGGKAFSSTPNRRLTSVQKNKETKMAEMKKVEERKKKVQAMLEGKLPLEEDADKKIEGVLGSSGNEAKDAMIKTGEMTPFGTVVQQRQVKDEENESKAMAQVKEEPSEDTRDHSSGVATVGLDDDDLQEHTLDQSDSKDRKPGRGDDDWVPSDADQWGDSDFEQPEVEESSKGRQKKHVSDKEKRTKGKNKNWSKKYNRPLYREGPDSDDDGERAPRAKAIRKYRDDGLEDYYDERMEKLRDTDLHKQRLRDAGRLSDSESEEEFDGGLRVPGRIWSKLYKYQKTCVKWLWELHCQEAGGIIGDEMGLGKTIQAIAYLAAMRFSKLGNKNFSYRGLGPVVIVCTATVMHQWVKEFHTWWPYFRVSQKIYRGLGPVVIVCPATVMHQWVKEFHTWWPYFRVSVLHSSGTHTGDGRALIRETVRSNGVLITSYNTLVIQKDNILPYNWHYVILDEGHKIRNPDAQATLVCKQFRTPHRVILSGSPIQNNLRELWSLMDFVFPGKLGTLPDFIQHFAVPIVQGGYSNATEIQVQTSYKCACVLRDTINPYLLRRMKADVKMTVNLPGKNEQVLFCRLTQEQKEVYQEYLGSNECSEIMMGRFAVFAGLIQLRKICNHPDLATGGPRVFKGDSVDNDPTQEYGFWKRAGKMIVCEALLKLWKKQGHKVLLFTQSSQMLDILESFVQKKGYHYVRMDGSTGISSRQPLVQRFNTDDRLFLFLLTTRVGGLGVNLTGANRIIIYDPDWNPSTDMQARERAWRIGQKRQVTIYRLLTTGSIEEKIYHRQIFKQFLTNRVLKDPKQRRLFKTNDLYELFSLGLSDDKGETETSALFAGTGSDVNVKLVKDNRFDRLRKQKEREKREREQQDEEQQVVEDTGATLNFSDDEITRMRELAKSLSRKMEVAKQDGGGKPSDNAGSKKSGSGSGSGSDSQDKKKSGSGSGSDAKDRTKDKKDGDNGAVISDTDKLKGLNRKSGLGSGTDSQDKKSGEKKVVDSGGAGGAVITNRDKLKGFKIKKKVPSATATDVTEASGSSSVLSQSTSQSKPSSSSDKTVGKEDARTSKYFSQSKRDSSVQSSSRPSSHSKKESSVSSSSKRGREEAEDKHRSHKKKKHKKHKDAKFEGERIPNLVKQREFKGSKSEANEEENAMMDNYVLTKLFKKTGIQGALKHDKIMDPGKADYVIVETEAEKVAKEASAALKRSKSQCLPASAGVPTWTGSHGSMAKRPRFGQKKNTAIAGPDADKPSTVKKVVQEPGKPKEHHFDGSLAGSVQTNIETGATVSSAMSSTDLLNKMRVRNEVFTKSSGAANDDENANDNDDDGTFVSDPTSLDLIKKMQEFILFQCTNIGMATTQELLDEFGPKLPPENSAKFRAMLRSICDFERKDDIGIWKLKSDFR